MRADPNDHVRKIHLRSWVWFGACCGMVLLALDGKNFYGAANITTETIAWTLARKALLGGIGGAIVGLLLGWIAIAIEPLLHPPKKLKKFEPRNRPLRLGWLIGLAVGLTIGGYNFLTSPDKIHHDHVMAACQHASDDLNAGQLALDSHKAVAAIAYANDALTMVERCPYPQSAADTAQASLIRAMAGYQAKIPYQDEAKKARRLASACAAKYARTDAIVTARCRTIVQGADEAATQHYCDAALRLSTDADDSIAHLAFDLGRNEANSAITNALQCKNPYAYAYHGMGLVKRGMATYLAGQKAAGTRDLATGKQLLDRCLSEIDVDTGQNDLRKNCAVQLTAARPFIGPGKS